MPSIDPILAAAMPFLFVLIRLSGLAITTPVFASITIPVRARAMLVVMLAAAVYPGVVLTVDMELARDLPGLLVIAVSELLIGASMGLIMMLVLSALELAGLTAGYQMGLSVARSYNPELGSESDPFGQMLFLSGIAMFLLIGGLDMLLMGLVRTFAYVPVGGFKLTELPLATVVTVLGSGFELAARVAAPVTAVALLVMLAIGMLGKTVPQLNVMTVGFAIKVVLGAGILAISIVVVEKIAMDEITRGLDAVSDWIAGLGESVAIVQTGGAHG